MREGGTPPKRVLTDVGRGLQVPAGCSRSRGTKGTRLAAAPQVQRAPAPLALLCICPATGQGLWHRTSAHLHGRSRPHPHGSEHHFSDGHRSPNDPHRQYDFKRRDAIPRKPSSGRADSLQNRFRGTAGLVNAVSALLLGANTERMHNST